MSLVHFFKRLWQRQWLFVPYVIFILLAIPRSLSLSKQLVYFAYALIIFVVLFIVYRARLKTEERAGLHTVANRRMFLWLLLFSLIFLVITRALPFYRHGEGALGYDTGFYLKTLQQLTGQGEETAHAYYLLFLPFRYLGLPDSVTFYLIYGLSQLLIAGGLYFFLSSIDSLKRYRFASVGVFLFSVSIIQFLAYWSAIGQQMLATGFLLLTLAFFIRQSWIMTMVMATTTFLIHTSTFAIFGLFLMIYLIFNVRNIYFAERKLNRKNFYLTLIALMILLIMFIVKRTVFFEQLQYIFGHGIFLSNYAPWKLAEARGIFISLSEFRLFILMLLPLGIFSLLFPWIWGRESLQPIKRYLKVLYLLIAALFILTFAPVLYQGRFSLLFELFLLILATPALTLLLEYFLRDRAGQALVLLFVLILSVRLTLTVWQKHPLIDVAEIAEIKKLDQLLEPRAIIMITDSSYTPWIYGFSKKDIIGPGHLYDKWSLSTWIEFWNGTDYQKKIELLRDRQQPLYIYLGARQPQFQEYQKFIRADAHFTQIGPFIWKFHPDIQ